MVWVGICGKVKTRRVGIHTILNAQRYRHDILQHLMACCGALSSATASLTHFQHDNARPHTAKLSQKFLANANVQVSSWPECSLDMIPMEHLWDHLYRQIRRRHLPPVNVQERCLL